MQKCLFAGPPKSGKEAVATDRVRPFVWGCLQMLQNERRKMYNSPSRPNNGKQAVATIRVRARARARVRSCVDNITNLQYKQNYLYVINIYIYIYNIFAGVEHVDGARQRLPGPHPRRHVPPAAPPRPRHGEGGGQGKCCAAGGAYALGRVECKDTDLSFFIFILCWVGRSRWARPCAPRHGRRATAGAEGRSDDVNDMPFTTLLSA